MAFCNSCGASIEPGNKFCNKCGAAIAGGVSTAPAPAAGAPGGSSALKIILIIVAVIVCLGLVGAAGIGLFVYHVAKRAHVTQQGNQVKVETPIGTLSASHDSEEAVKELGAEMYPGAQVQKQGTASATFGSVHTVAANLETSDPLDKVCDFYKTKFPGATVVSSDQNQCSIVSGGSGNSVTISVEASGGITRIHIANVSKGSSSD